MFCTHRQESLKLPIKERNNLCMWHYTQAWWENLQARDSVESAGVDWSIISTDPTEIRWRIAEWFHPVHDTDKWRYLNTVTKPRVQ